MKEWIKMISIDENKLTLAMASVIWWFVLPAFNKRTAISVAWYAALKTLAFEPVTTSGVTGVVVAVSSLVTIGTSNECATTAI